MFKEFAMVFLIIIVHEFGHLGAAIYFKWQTDKIVIYPFGGCLKFDEKINRSLKEELIILIAGPLTQVLLCFVMSYLSTKGIMTYRNLQIFKTYHYTLLIFNLLPIYPLDGGRLINIIFNYLFPFKEGNRIVSFISIIIAIFMMFSYRNLNFTMMGVLIVSEIFIYLKRQNILYNKMLLERYLGNFNFKRLKTINSKDKMYKECRHVILYNHKYITEKDYLKERYKVK